MTIYCDPGYEASSTATLNCVDGKWDGPVPQCMGKNCFTLTSQGIIEKADCFI